MHRAYDVGRFADLIGEIHERLPYACIGTDVMAGFPGETEALFDQTCRFIEQMPFSYLHVFPFSRRSGTPAAGMANQVQESDKSRRVEVLRQLSARKLRAFEDRFSGQTLRALVLNEHEGSERIGLTGNYLKLRLPLESPRANEFIRVTIERRGECLYGIPAQN
jgi:threonylcarbamoyladenosine tRNA methylthiotransferase MtaB